MFKSNLLDYLDGNLDVTDSLPNITTEENTAVEMSENGINAIQAEEAGAQLEGEVEVLDNAVNTFGAVSTAEQEHVENIDRMEVEGVEPEQVALECAKITELISKAAGNLGIPMEDPYIKNVYDTGLNGINSRSLQDYKDGVLGIGDFLKKVKDKIVSFFKMIWNKIKQFWNWLFKSGEDKKALQEASTVTSEEIPEETEIPEEEKDDYAWDVLESSLLVDNRNVSNSTKEESNAIKEATAALTKLDQSLQNENNEEKKKEVSAIVRDIASGKSSGDESKPNLTKLEDLKAMNPNAYDVCIRMMNISRVQHKALKANKFTLSNLGLELAGNSKDVLNEAFGTSAIGPDDICIVDIEGGKGKIRNVICTVSYRDHLVYTLPLQVAMRDNKKWINKATVTELMNKCKSVQDQVISENKKLFSCIENDVSNAIQGTIKLLEKPEDKSNLAPVVAEVVKNSAKSAMKKTRSRGKGAKALQKVVLMSRRRRKK